MGSDAAMVNGSAPAISKDIGKKKKTNRSAKLKQCKLDARREQWLSQVKSKGCNVMNDRMSPRPLSPHPMSLPRSVSSDPREKSPKEEENDIQEVLQDSDIESPINSPTSSSSGTNYMRKDCPSNSGSSHSSSGSYSRSTSEAEEDEDEEGGGGGEGGLDDWEAVADALTISNNHQDNSKSETNITPVEHTAHTQLQNVPCSSGILKKPEINGPAPRAWLPDDAFRPQSLPSLSKNHSFPINMERHSSHGTIGWVNEGLVHQPSSCPICYEDLDLTDTSFLPCTCGFHLCLFCHKRILEDDGRCPGCRKQYSPMVGGETFANGSGDAPLSFRLSRSCSLSSRS